MTNTTTTAGRSALFDFGIRGAFEYFGWCIYLRGFQARYDVPRCGFLTFSARTVRQLREQLDRRAS